MERVIRLFVKNEIFFDDNLPLQESRFFPLSRDIRNHMYTATNKLRLSNKINEIKSSNGKRNCQKITFFPEPR